MQLDISNVYTRVLANRDEVAWLEKLLSFPQTEYRNGRAHTHQITLYSRGRQHFPTGLVPRVRRSAKTAGLRLAINDTRLRPCWDNGKPLAFLEDPLRGPFQRKAVATTGTWSRGVFDAATGARL